uniref:Importin N-terminal domain-containing protein n=1 Tax=Octactis speculum TaxID=3111310 RepID=A0A7S2AWL8_9STRA|mmetsp:Transcript_16839/g.22635  ORF Transcript_16839/g.22635 Transcript_16839/m.22635 type:complete len:1109 (+) Transcript_16839:236-3562(+)|eukprot:CAMPEP_0185769098 /NCGR_PEP_ID=MMETSP1174-20130828/53368_1 /TAXON_ID=35687 /ORGANISM="Dictyocha speculum, Strain CCMP1381" /LENGTH=1108 /DNA_ID=CAMNT_0028454055 /DNA_START=223 /DNA_END=3549 /DNA_ORIENTATION=-
MTQTMEQAAACLLDFTQPFDVRLFEQVVGIANDPRNSQLVPASHVLVQLQEHPDMWTRADQILEQATHPSARFIGLNILGDAIRTRWKVLPEDQRSGIKNYVVQKIIALSSSEESMHKEKTFLQKVNLVLVHILKHEWPQHWPEFISEIISASMSNEILCENNMQILKLLSEEVFEVKGQMTTAKTKKMKEALNSEFIKIFQLCEMVLNASQRPTLINGTLLTLQRFLTWIPLGFIFETQIINLLTTKFFPVPQFRNACLECLAEIACLGDPTPHEYDSILVNQLYLNVMNQLVHIVQPDTALLTRAFLNGGEETFIKLLALFLSGFFRTHLSLLETPEQTGSLMQGMLYLIGISEVPDNEVFKICLEYWHVFSSELYASETQGFAQQQCGLNLGPSAGHNGSSRKHLYQRDLLSRVRSVMIANMAKPEEVLVVEDENGDVIREIQKDTEVIAQYKTMRETLVYLTHLNYDDTEAIMLEKLSAQVDGSSWSWNNLNTLCWAIGSISGAMSEEEEKRFLVIVIKDLLGLCEDKRGKDNKAVIASNIMYVVGQYPRFLRAHWKFLKTVVNKLFEFMHELHPGVQDMACDTFLKIAHKCKRKFVTLQQNEEQPFIMELAQMVPSIISHLEAHQVHTFYEAAACMLSERALSEQRHSNMMVTPQLDRQGCLDLLMALPNNSWRQIMQQASSNLEETFNNPEKVREIIKILKTNERVCSSVGPPYIHQLSALFNDLMNVYKYYADQIVQAVALHGPIATRHALVKSMRTVKKEVLLLLTTFIGSVGDPEAPPSVVAQSILPELLLSTSNSVLGDYNRSIPNARDPEVLGLYSAAISKLPMDAIKAPGGTIDTGAVPRLMEALFECTLQMIMGNFEDFPEIRIQFFTLLKAINQHCFEALFSIPESHQKLVVDSVAFAIKHTERTVADTGLDILFDLLQNASRTPQFAQVFYQKFLLSLLQDLLYVMTDRLHKSGFKMHATLLRHMFHVVELGQVTVPLFDHASVAPGTTNQTFLREHIANLLLSSFPNLTKNQVIKFVSGLMDRNMDLPTFKSHLRDFLVALKEFSVEDNQGLYDEERQKQHEQDMAKEQARRAAVPGLVNPYEVADPDMADL